MLSLAIEQLRALAPQLPDSQAAELVVYLAQAMAEFDITTPQRAAAFLAQLTHETGGFRYIEELWGPSKQQLRYEPPSTLAKKLGNDAKGDGYKYRGRGFIQLTGKSNYRAAGNALGVDLVKQPTLAAAPAIAARVAAWYWHENGLNSLADAGDYLAITKRINGGVNGLDERMKYWKKAKSILGIPEGIAA